MALDLSKLTDAVTKVAGLAADNAAMKKDIQDAQASIDTLTASLLAAVTTPAEAVGISAVAAALAPETPAVAVAAAPAVSLDAMVQAMKAPQ